MTGRTSGSDAFDEESVVDAIYAMDARGLRELMIEHDVDPDLQLGEPPMPLVHMALDAEIERGIGDPEYEPSGECLAVLLELGADPTARYLGESVIEGVAGHTALTRVRDKIDRWLEGRT